MLKKNLTPWYVTSFSRGLEKKILPKPNYPYPPSKVKSSAPNSRVRWPISCKICDNMLVSFLPKYRHFCKTNADTHVIFMTVLKIIYYINSIFKYSCKCDFLFCAYRGVASAGGGGIGLPENPSPIVNGVPSLFSAGMLINQIFVSRCFCHRPKYGSHRQHIQSFIVRLNIMHLSVSLSLPNAHCSFHF